MGNNAELEFRLRPLTASDAPSIARLIGDWEVVRWLSGPPYPYAIADAAEFLAKVAAETSSPLRHDAIEISGQFAGLASIDRRSRGYNLGYWLGRPFWGHGIMTKAATALTADFFAKSDEPSLMSGYFSGNEASWAIQRRLGFEWIEDGKLFNRANGMPMPHSLTRLTRARFDAIHGQLPT